MRASVAAAIGYAALVLLLTWPLARHLPSVLPVDLQDSLLSTSALWWNAHVTPLSQQWWDGFAFFPEAGTITFSDHRLGVSLIATPLQWAGLSAVTAYNLTLLATFPLCALAAHWLAFTVTGRHDAATLAGLKYGFNPYRIAHLNHLELLAAFGMPAALAALHLYVRTRRRAWLIVFGLALTIQALCASYYALFFCVLLSLWLLWFLRWRDRPMIPPIVAAWVCGLGAVTPIAIGYWRVHAAYGLTRRLDEVQTYSAGLGSFLTTSPLVALWRWLPLQPIAERQLFPGATVLILVLAGVWQWRRRYRSESPAMRDPLAATAAGLAGASIVCIGVALISGAAPPLSLALAALAASIALHPAVRASFARRSPLAFYLIATVILYLCSLGPAPSFAGRQVLWQTPYAWLMHLPVFADGVRAPARFAMLAELTLSMAAALAFDKLTRLPRRRTSLAVLLAAGLVADTWIRGLPLLQAPETWPVTDTRGLTAALTLPLGGVQAEPDAAAMYRATLLGLRSVNGISGYSPEAYSNLEEALNKRDPAALDGLAQHGSLLIAVDREADRDHRWTDFVAAQSGVARAGSDDRWTIFRLARRER